MKNQHSKNHILFRHSLRFKIFLFNLVTILSSFFLYSTILIQNEYYALRAQSLQMTQTSIQQINTYVNKDLSHIRQLLLNSILNPSVSDTLNADNSMKYQTFSQWLGDYTLIYTLITESLYSLNLHDIHIITDNALATAYHSDFCIDLYDLKDTLWYEEAQSTLYSFFFNSPSVFENSFATEGDYIYFTLNLNYLYNSYETYFIGAIPKNILDSLVSIENNSAYISCSLINSNGELLTFNFNQSYLDEWLWVKDNIPASRSVRLDNMQINGKNYYISVSSIHNTDLSLIYIFDYNRIILDTLVTSIRQYLPVLVLIISLVLVFSIWIVNSLTRNISILNEHMLQAGEGNFNVSILPGNKHDEISSLNRHFNYMLTKLSLLMDSQAAAERQIRKLELTALQAQINPHFLYNTLELVKWKSIANKDYELGDIVDAMTSYYKIALSHGQELIPLKTELAHIEAYVYIQNKRFEDGIELNIHISDCFLNYQVPKLILQPIVENAIIHGIRETDSETGIISITMEESSSDYQLIITDTGVGIPPDQLAHLLDTFSTNQVMQSGYGIRNVHQRIQLTFGMQYGLTIKSTAGAGTSVTISLPQNKNE